MKRLSTLVCALLAWSMALWAAPVDEAAARQLAVAFLSGTPSLRAGQTAATTPLTTAYVATRTDGGAHYYVFNRGRAEGFVIVSGDDRAEAVLGYADRGAFHPDSIPPAMRWWLGEYAREMEAWTGTDADRRTDTRQPSEAVIAPLLGDIAWSQMAPYNGQCPLIGIGNRAATGCGATAMAQIMAYHRHPEQGTGQHSYLWNAGRKELSADFGNTRYDWDNMIGSYKPGTGYTQEQADAVATLMYHCGVSVNMEYGPESGAFSADIALALYQYFDYDGSISYRSRDYYPADEWETLILAELQAERPVFYGGQAPKGGHAFVCDGYDGQGFFHINWGWDGLYNGHFRLNALNPEGQGTGGYEGGYNSMQEAIIGIQPDAGGAPDAEMISQGAIPLDKTIKKNSGLIRIATALYNFGWNTVRVAPGLMIHDSKGTLVKTLPMYKLTELTPLAGWLLDETTSPYVEYFPSELTDGVYYLRFGFQSDRLKEWRIIPTLQTQPVAVKATIEGNTVHFAPVMASELPDFEPETALDTPESAAALLLYPNPAGDHVTVCSDEGVHRLRLYSPDGTLQRDENARGASEHRLDLHGLPAGTYLLSVETPAGIRTERVMKR